MNKNCNLTTADTWFSKAIRLRDRLICQCCGKTGHDLAEVDCAHLVGRREKIIRWDAENAVTLCRGCHTHFGTHPAEFEHWVRTCLHPDHDWDALQRRRRGILKVNKSRVAEIAQHYREQCRAMEKNKAHRLDPYVPYEVYALRAV